MVKDGAVDAVHAATIKFTFSASGGGLNMLNGCEGLEALSLLIAAFAVAPLWWPSRLLGAVPGIVVVFFINQGRILVLFYSYRANREWFDPLHATLTPIAVVMLVCARFEIRLSCSRD